MILDSEFGRIKTRKSAFSKNLKISVGVDGVLTISAPAEVGDGFLRKFVDKNRSQIREMAQKYASENFYRDGQKIGQRHWLVFRKVKNASPRVEICGNQILVFCDNLENIAVQAEIRKVVAKVLRKEAKEYLPARVAILVRENGFEFEKLKFTHSKTRWGSCSSRGTISLNIALMNLPLRLIDYVIIHELCHTRQMNHSSRFWVEVERVLPEYKILVEEIKRFSPQI